MTTTILNNDADFYTQALSEKSREISNPTVKIGFMARALVQASLPHSKINKEDMFHRTNGLFTLSIISSPDIGLPYGNLPRLLMAWITTKAVQTKQRELALGSTLSQFMAEFNLTPTGGQCGTVTRIKDQLRRLLSSAISCSYDGESWAIEKVQPVSRADLWWYPAKLSRENFFESTITLNETFFNEITTSPIPIDFNVLKALKRSPMAMDIYCWLTYRMSYLYKTTTISWRALQTQFGAGYATDYQGTRNFKRAFVKELCKVLYFYEAPYVAERKKGLLLKPSPTHIPLLLCPV